MGLNLIHSRYLLGFFVLTAPVLSQGQIVFGHKQIRVTIPLHSELTPVQKLNREGVEAVESRHYDKAEDLFYKAYLFDPADPFTLNNLGYVSELQGRVDKAENFYRLAVQQGCYATIDRSSDKDLKGKPMMDALGTIKNLPMRINRLNILGMQLLSQGRAFEAQTLFQSSLALDPGNAFTLNDLGVADESVGDFASALKHYDEAAVLHSTQPVVVALKTSTRGKPVSEVAAQAATELRKHIKDSTPDQLRALMLTIRGVAATNQNNWDEGRKDFVEAYALDPQSAFALNNLGYVAERDGDLETARSYYARALRADDGDRKVGLSTESGMQGERIAALATDSHIGVDAALTASAQVLHGEGGPVELIPRNSQSLQPDSPAESPSPAPPAPSTPPATQVPASPQQ
jgi:Flp pilus assembly protein TadD